MKTFIYKTNQYLLERFPTIWNTRLVWMLAIAICLHLVFFVFGYMTLSNPKLLQERFVKSIFFENGSVFLSIIISVLLLVGWLIFMFKNNAFKNFYPTNLGKLFGQFLSYVLIILTCTSFYISYQYGLKVYIASTYSDTQINKEIQVANDAALFLSKDISDYKISQRRYPKPFYDLYCEVNNKFIDFEKPHLNFEDDSYQFYTLRIEEVSIKDHYRYISNIEPDNDSINNRYVFTKISDTTRTYFYKDSVVNMAPFVKSTLPTYYNMSSTFFVSKNDTLQDDAYNFDYNYSDYSNYDYLQKSSFSKRSKYRNKRNYELLKQNNKNEIKQLLVDFLKFSDTYKIDHNLTAEKWFELVYHPNSFEVKNFIRTQAKDDYSYTHTVAIEQSKTETFYYDRLTDYHYENDALRNVFENIEDIKDSDPIETIHMFMWIAFIMSCLIFIFRITGLKHLLFSVITVGVLSLVISLTAALLFYLMQSNDDFSMYFISYFTLVIASIILLIPIFFAKRIKKLIVAIYLNISIIGFPLYLLLIIGIISMHQNDACLAHPDYNTDGFVCRTLMDTFDVGWSWILFFSGIIFIYFYTKVIKNWKSLPQG